MSLVKFKYYYFEVSHIIQGFDSEDGFIFNLQAQIVKDTNTKISSMSSGVVTNKEAVISQLLDKVLNVQPDLHQNFRKGA